MYISKTFSFSLFSATKKNNKCNSNQNYRTMGTETSYEQQGLLHEMFSKQAKKTPDKIAIVEDSGAKITFKELDESSDKLGKHLVHKGVKINSCVAIYLDKSIAYVTAYIAILKAGQYWFSFFFCNLSVFIFTNLQENCLCFTYILNLLDPVCDYVKMTEHSFCKEIRWSSF